MSLFRFCWMKRLNCWIIYKINIWNMISTVFSEYKKGLFRILNTCISFNTPEKTLLSWCAHPTPPQPGSPLGPRLHCEEVHLGQPSRTQLVSMALTPQWLLFHQVNILEASRNTGYLNFDRDGKSWGKRAYTSSPSGKVARLPWGVAEGLEGDGQAGVWGWGQKGCGGCCGAWIAQA